MLMVALCRLIVLEFVYGNCNQNTSDEKDNYQDNFRAILHMEVLPYVYFRWSEHDQYCSVLVLNETKLDYLNDFGNFFNFYKYLFPLI